MRGGKIVVGGTRTAIAGYLDRDLGNIIAFVEFRDPIERVDTHFQYVSARRDSGDIDPLTRNIVGVDICPATPNALVTAVIEAIYRSVRIPSDRVFQAKTNLLTVNHLNSADGEQAIFGELTKVIMSVAVVVNEERVVGWITKHQIPVADVARFGFETEQSPRAGHSAAFIHLATAGCEVYNFNIGAGGRTINHEVGSPSADDIYDE